MRLAKATPLASCTAHKPLEWEPLEEGVLRGRGSARKGAHYFSLEHVLSVARLIIWSSGSLLWLERLNFFNFLDEKSD